MAGVQTAAANRVASREKGGMLVKIPCAAGGGAASGRAMGVARWWQLRGGDPNTGGHRVEVLRHFHPVASSSDLGGVIHDPVKTMIKVGVA
jgi:hypothetical protein